MPNYDPSVFWSDDEIASTDKLNQMVQNIDVIYNSVPHFLNKQGDRSVLDFSTAQSQVLKPTIYTGRQTLSGLAGRYAQSRNVFFPPGTFAASCKPVVQCTVSAVGHERYVLLTISNLNGNSRVVGNAGFKVRLSHRDGEKFKTDGVSLHYMVFGWQAQ